MWQSQCVCRFQSLSCHWDLQPSWRLAPAFFKMLGDTQDNLITWPNAHFWELQCVQFICSERFWDIKQIGGLVRQLEWIEATFKSSGKWSKTRKWPKLEAEWCATCIWKELCKKAPHWIIEAPKIAWPNMHVWEQQCIESYVVRYEILSTSTSWFVEAIHKSYPGSGQSLKLSNDPSMAMVLQNQVVGAWASHETYLV